MEENAGPTAVGFLCRLDHRNARSAAIRIIQQYAECHFGIRLTTRQLRRLAPMLCNIDDTAALHTAIESVRLPHREWTPS